MNFTKDQLAKAKECKNVEELLSFAKELGLNLSNDEAKLYLEQWQKEGELSDEELDNVAGGSECINGRSYSTSLECRNLITTAGNVCDAWERGNYDYVEHSCGFCKYHFGSVPMYCSCRTAEHDPFNSAIGNGFYYNDMNK